MPAAGVVTANLLAEYQFVGVGSGATVSDTSGNGNTLTLGHTGSAVLVANGNTYGSPTWAATGLTFDTGTIATLADNSVVTTSTTNFSVELWVKPITVTFGRRYFNLGWNDHDLSDGFNAGFCPAFSTEWARTDTSITSNSVNVTTPGGASFPVGHWYQVVITREPSTGKLTTYVGGVHQNDNWSGAAAWDTSGMPFPSSTFAAARTIGADVSDPSSVHAEFGELRFYGSVLSGADVLQNYNARALDVTGSAPAAPRKPSSGLSGGMKPLMNGGLNA